MSDCGKCKPLSAYLCPQPTMPVRPMGDCEPFGLSDAERALFDCITTEHVGIIGTEFLLFRQDFKRSIVDPLYNEPVKRAWDGPYALRGFFQIEKETQATQEGLRSDFDGTIWIARSEVERVNLPEAPNETDIIRVWDRPFFNTEFAVDDFDIPGAGLYFSITEVVETGFLFDNPYFVGFECKLRRTTTQTPERKLPTSI